MEDYSGLRNTPALTSASASPYPGGYKRTVTQESGDFVGTPIYLSPEMIDAQISGPFTDLWALGVVVY